MKCFYKENNTLSSNHQHVVCAFNSACYVLGLIDYFQDRVQTSWSVALISSKLPMYRFLQYSFILRRTAFVLCRFILF